MLHQPRLRGQFQSGSLELLSISAQLAAQYDMLTVLNVCAVTNMSPPEFGETP
jgi:hypothetical protein